MYTAAELVSGRMRQIHLDFHTSPQIADVGSEFNSDQFGDTLEEARVNWVTLFAKCHHGMSYYPTKVGVMHPGLKFDLLGEQIEACKKRGIATPVYISVRVDQYIGITRSDMVCRLEDGRLWGPNASQAGWYQICLGNREYIDYLASQTEEVLKNYDADGIFYDMCYFPPDPGCFCEKCIAKLEENGGSRTDKERHRQQTFSIMREYTTRLAALCRELKPNATIFFNSRVTPDVHKELDALTHLEIESLTTGGWGYLYYPAWSRLLRTYSRPLQGMTARFHKSWADFGGLKTVPQLDYEAATILAAGGVVNIGDQLHPRGKLDQGAYQLIGRTFRKVEALEPYCLNAEPLADIAVLLLPQTLEGSEAGQLSMNSSYEGAAAVLMALKHQWNGETPDRAGNLKNYKLVIIPDKGVIDDPLKNKLSEFREQGGSILFSHEASLHNTEFSVPGSPALYKGPCPYTPSYMKLGSLLGKDMPDTELVNYQNGSYITPQAGAQPLGEVWQPYFNRTPGHFSSHNQTPVDKPTGYPVGVLSADKKVGYLYGAMFAGYKEDSFFVYKEVLSRMIEQLLPKPLIIPGKNCPAALEISLLRQKIENRMIVHLINFQPQRRTSSSEYIESVTPIHNVEFSVRTGNSPYRALLAPEGTPLSFKQEGDYCRLVIPVLEGHQAVEINL